MNDLNFDGHNTIYATHGVHSYAAKCPPQLAKYGIENYSQIGDTLLDPMAGSGTTLVEAKLSGRNAIGYDIDPLACLIAQVKCRELPDKSIEDSFDLIIENVKKQLNQSDTKIDGKENQKQFDMPEFLNRAYWFSPEVSNSLSALSAVISNTQMTDDLRDFFWVAFSSIILTKVSVANARDIIHSRHHYFEHKVNPNVIQKFSDKVQKMRKQMAELQTLCGDIPKVDIVVEQSDARELPLEDNSIDLVFTSPPYATALDYPRAHFLSVAWMQKRLGLDLEQYKTNGATYIGSERGHIGRKFQIDEMISSFSLTKETLLKLAVTDIRQANLIQRYFVDMTKVLREINRVLKLGSSAIIVVCPSHIRKIEIQTHKLLTEIAEQSNLKLKEEHTRTINGNKRILPYMRESFGDRMSTEYVLVFQKEV